MSTDARAYWEQRLEARAGLAGVGWDGLGEGLNAWMYRVRRQVFLDTVRAVAGSHLAQMRVLDVGSGTGFYVERWRELGVASITASDLTDVAVARLRERMPELNVRRLDVADALPGESWDAISAMDVLFHVVDEDAYDRAWRNLAAALAPGGLLLATENLLRAERVGDAHHVSRSEARVRAAVGGAGLELVAVRPMFVLLNTPVDSTSRPLWWWWEGLARTAGRAPRLGSALGAAAYGVERELVRRTRRGPSTKLLVCRKP